MYVNKTLQNITNCILKLLKLLYLSINKNKWTLGCWNVKANINFKETSIMSDILIRIPILSAEFLLT